MGNSRQIRPIEWIGASEVLAHEERDFTVWLADNLEPLGEALGLEELTLVERESRVESFRADILAVADDGSEDGLPVIIENQYGRTDHGHLGKLITYLAAQQRGLGVWVVEEPAAPHLAAVEFLNRTSDASVGYAVVVVRFAPGPEDSHLVDFDVVTAPNAWLEELGTLTSRPRRGVPERFELLAELTERIEEPLRQTGWEQVKLVGNGRHIRLWPPRGHPLGGRRSRVTVRSSARELTLRHTLRAESFDVSWKQVEVLRRRYADRLETDLPKGTEVRWHSGEDRVNARNDQLLIVHPDGGYADLSVETAATWVTAVATSWLQILTEDPIDPTATR